MSRRSPQLQRLLVLLKTQKTNSPASDWWKYNKYRFKENAKIFSKNSITQEKFRISKSKKVYEIYTKKKILNQKSNQWLKTYFVLTLGSSWRAKNAPKLSSEYLKDRICKFQQYLNYILMIIDTQLNYIKIK